MRDVVISLAKTSRSRLPVASAVHARGRDEIKGRHRDAERNETATRPTKESKSPEIVQAGHQNTDSTPTSTWASDDDRGRSRERQATDVSQDPDMISIMGFGGFGSTKGKHVAGAKGGSAKKKEVTEYRQYMNRSKGFNRPLSPGK